MKTRLLFMQLLMLGCGPLVVGRVDTVDSGMHVDGGPAVLGSSPIEVTELLSGRSRLGARSASGFRLWGGGLAVVDGWLYWVESGKNPGLYRLLLADCHADCVESVATMTRPTVFSATDDSVLVADITSLKRYRPSGSPQAIATANAEFSTLVAHGTSAFWTAENSNAVNVTPFGGPTSMMVTSNGTPISIAVAGDRLHWVGSDISGLVVAMQSMKLDGTNPREDRRFTNGFSTMRGNDTYLYFAKDSPAHVYRLTMSNGFLEEVATNAQGVADFALDATHAYWVEPATGANSNGRVRRVAHESTSAEVIAQSIAMPVALALQGSVLYVASAGSQAQSFNDGKILQITVPSSR